MIMVKLIIQQISPPPAFLAIKTMILLRLENMLNCNSIVK